MNLLSLGAIIEVKDQKLCVIGYSVAEKTCGYFTVPYPLGFIDVEKIFFIPYSSTMKIIDKGYNTAESERVMKAFSQSIENAKKMTDDELRALLRAYKIIKKNRTVTEE